MNARDDVTAKEFDALRADMQQLRTDFAAANRTLKDLAGALGSDAYEQVREKAGQARERAEEAAETVSRTIEDRPFASVAIAFVVGLVIGLLFGRQR